MGGINLNDILTPLYRIDIQTRKRWYLKIITHLVDISNINGWLIYIRYMKQLAVLKKNQVTLLQFTKELLMSYCLEEKQQSTQCVDQRKEAIHQCLRLTRNPWNILLAWLWGEKKSLQSIFQIHLSNVKNAKWTYASRRVEIVSSNLIIKNNTFWLNLNIIWTFYLNNLFEPMCYFFGYKNSLKPIYLCIKDLFFIPELQPL